MNNSGQVAWVRFDGKDDEICLYDGVSVNQLTYNSLNDDLTDINSSGQVVWEGDDGSDTHVYFYNGDSIIQISDDSHESFRPRINDSGQVVWREVWREYGGITFSGIYLFNGTSVIQLSDNDVSYYSKPQINNSGHVVWVGDDGTPGTEIFLFPQCPYANAARISGTTPVYYSTLQDAYESAFDAEVIQATYNIFDEDLYLDIEKSVYFEGGWKCGYEYLSDVTLLTGNVVISNGTFVITQGLLKLL